MTYYIRCQQHKHMWLILNKHMLLNNLTVTNHLKMMVLDNECDKCESFYNNVCPLTSYSKKKIIRLIY